MAEFRTVVLQEDIADFDHVAFLRADLSAKNSPFAVIHYAYDGEEQKLGLRLDLDKLVFLDHPEDIDPEIANLAAKKIAKYLTRKHRVPTSAHKR